MNKTYTISFLSACLMAPSVAFSQNDDAQDTIEEVIVTSTKRETTLMETPVAVSSFSQEDLDVAGTAALLDIEDLVPNLQIGLSPTDSGVQIVVRGLSSNNFTELGDPTVATHFDGLYSPRPQAGLALMHDVERTEINRGPQGTLFGRNSTAGSINVISARPDFEEMAGNIDLTLGRFNQQVAKGWLNLPVSENFGLRASFVRETQDAWLTTIPDTFDLAFDGNSDGDFDDDVDIAPDGIPNVDQRRNRQVGADEAYTAIDRNGFRISARYVFGEDNDWNLIYDHFNDQSPGQLSIKDCEKSAGTYFACDHAYDVVAVNVPGELDMEMNSIRSIFSMYLSDEILLEHRLAYSSQERFQVNDTSVGDYLSPLHPTYGFSRQSVNGEFDLGPLIRDFDLIDSLGFIERTVNTDGSTDVVVPVGAPFEDIQQTTRSSEYDSWVTELQLKSEGEGRLQWITGLFYMKEENAIQFEVEIPFCCGSFEPLGQVFNQPERTIESAALFAQFDFAVTDRLDLTAGIRYTRDEKADNRGSIHQTVGFAAPNPGLYFEPSFQDRGINPLSYVFLGNPGNELYQADDLLPTDGTLNPDFINRVPGTDNSHSNSWSQTTWKLGFAYEATDDLFAYGYVATGFKAGGFGDAIFVCDSCGTTNTFDYDPETNITYEIGLKSSHLDGRLNLLANFFYSDYQDLQQSRFDNITNAGEERPYADGFEPNDDAIPCTADPTVSCEIVQRDIGTFLTRNIGEARSMGFEFEFNWIPWDNGRIYGWLAWLDAEITDYETQEDWYCLDRALLGLTNCGELVDTGNGDLGRPINLKGNKLPWSPEFSYTVNAEHRFDLGNSLIFSPHVSMSWQDDIYFDNSNFDEGPYHSGQDAYATYNASLRLWSETDGWGVEVFGYNLTDELVRNWADRGPGFMKASFAPPRQYGMKVNWNF